MENSYFKGRGSQINTSNRYFKNSYSNEHIEGLDEVLLSHEKTKFFEEAPKKIVNKVSSPDAGMMYSLNPYQGCEHGCIYCYARNSHQYWGYSAGLDFERKIIIKHNAPDLLEKQFLSKNWKPFPITISGNTDCYQPIEQKLKLTRSLLEVFLKYKNPVSIITKNSLILRDLDILSKLAKLQLVHVMISITSLNENLRLKMEPRTATYQNRLKTIEELHKAGVPVGVMAAPIIPGLNSKDIPSIIENAAKKGAQRAGYTIVRLNDAVHDIFKDWVYKNFPDAADKIMQQIMECHGGKTNDSRFGKRMSGEGQIAMAINKLFKISVKKHIVNESNFEFNLHSFNRNNTPGQLELF